ncbi:helix-turn-helix domain-containing protein [Larkinella soli]|uniref:helix-turn-helix domain-containing protein n=1 Tax=Larkinella soli TaxID=1770527 RepID=UPI000FFBBC8B|nr:helix-turn-helix transcriptional regulator [Larkinella soli]
MNIGAQIRILRQQKGYSQENMAEMLGLSTTAYGDIERGKTDLTIARLQQIATALGTTPAQLLSGEPAQSPELYPAEVVHQVETLQLEREKQELELDKLRLEVEYWKRKAEDLALVSVVRALVPPEDRPRIGFK